MRPIGTQSKQYTHHEFLVKSQSHRTHWILRPLQLYVSLGAKSMYNGLLEQP